MKWCDDMMIAHDVERDLPVEVEPFGVLNGDRSALILVDVITDGGLSLDTLHADEDWMLWPDESDGDEVGYVYSTDRDEWERLMNDLLIDYGLTIIRCDDRVVATGSMRSSCRERKLIMNGQEAYDLLKDYIRNSGFDPDDWDLDEARDLLLERCGDQRPSDVDEDDIADVLMQTDLSI